MGIQTSRKHSGHRQKHQGHRQIKYKKKRSTGNTREVGGTPDTDRKHRAHKTDGKHLDTERYKGLGRKYRGDKTG